MATITIQLNETQYKSLEYAALSPEDWAVNAVTERARIAKEEIIALLVKHCNNNNIQLATGEDAQVQQAFDLEIVKTAAQRQIDAENESIENNGA